MLARSALAGGARLFDEGRFFEAHEAWEAHWLTEKDVTTRRVLQGLIQIAAGFHKLVDKSSPESARRLLERGLVKLGSTDEADLAIVEFREAVRACATQLAQGRFQLGALPQFGLDG